MTDLPLKRHLAEFLSSADSAFQPVKRYKPSELEEQLLAPLVESNGLKLLLSGIDFTSSSAFSSASPSSSSSPRLSSSAFERKPFSVSQLLSPSSPSSRALSPPSSPFSYSSSPSLPPSSSSGSLHSLLVSAAALSTVFPGSLSPSPSFSPACAR